MPKAEEAEWVSVARSSAYFGPTLPIFRFLDKDDEAQRWVEMGVEAGVFPKSIGFLPLAYD